MAHGRPVDGMMADDDFIATPARVDSLLDGAARRFADRPAIDFLGRVWTWRAIAALAARAAAGLQRLGVGKGTRVGLCLPNTPYSVIMYFAVLKAGGIVVNFNPLYTEPELAAQARDSGTDVIVTLDVPMIADKIRALAGQGVFSHVVVCSMTAALPPAKSLLFRLVRRREIARLPASAPFIGFGALIAGDREPAPVEIDPSADIAVLQYTGGTTGVPKAAMLTHTNLIANVRQVRAVSAGIVEGGERILAVLPFFHVFAMTTIMNFGASIGAALILLPRPDMKLIMATIARARPTILPGVPTLYTAICNAARPGQDFSFIRFCIAGGAPMPREAATRFERLAGREVLEGYGLTEASPVVTGHPPGRLRHGSVGIALPGTTIEIRDPEAPHDVLPAGARGEICVRGPQVMAGYHNRPSETEAVFVDGALRTGDIGYLDEDGYLFIVDRIKDLILCGGFNVYPRVIEEAAYRHPAVQDATAIGVPDEYRGQSPKLFVTLRAGATASGDDILAFLATRLNRIEIPKSVEIRAELPRTMVGKLSKKELVAEAAAQAARAKACPD